MKRANVTAVLFLCNIVMEITFVVGFVAGKRFLDLFGMTVAQLGLFFAAGNAGWIVCSFLAGHATHRWGVLPVLTAGLWASLAGIALLMGANRFGMLLAGSILIGITFPFVSNANATLLAELYPEKLRRMASLAAGVWFGSAALIAPMIGRFLVIAKERVWGRWGFAAPYGVCLICVVACIAAVRLVLGTRKRRRVDEGGAEERSGNGEVPSAGKGWMWILCLSVLHGIMLITIMTWATKMGQEKFELVETTAAMIYSAVAIGLGGGRLLLAYVRLRMDERAILAVSATLGALLYCAGLGVRSFGLTMITMGAAAVLGCATFPCLTAIVGTRFKDQKAKLYGIMGMGIAIGGVIGPAAVGMLSERGVALDKALVVVPLAGLALACAAVAWLLSEKRADAAVAGEGTVTAPGEGTLQGEAAEGNAGL